MKTLAKLLERLVARLPSPEVITGGGNKPYLSKYMLWRSNPTKQSVRLQLHRFHRSDEDEQCHDHPWSWAISFVLVGGYREERRVYFDTSVGRLSLVLPFVRKPWRFNTLRADTFHRVDLLDGECWTLFFSGPVVKSWGFWDRLTGQYWPWREFIARKGYEPVEPRPIAPVL